MWAGSPAKFLRNLEPDEEAFIAKSAANYSELSSIHKCKWVDAAALCAITLAYSFGHTRCAKRQTVHGCHARVCC